MSSEPFKNTPTPNPDSSSPARRSQRRLLAVLAAILAAALTTALAATLGGANSGQLGSGAATVLSCDTDGVDAWWFGTWDFTENSYVVTEIHLGDVNPNCDGQTIDLAVTGGGHGTTVVDVTSPEWPYVIVPLVDGPTGSDFNDLAVVITGGLP